MPSVSRLQLMRCWFFCTDASFGINNHRSPNPQERHVQNRRLYSPPNESKGGLTGCRPSTGDTSHSVPHLQDSVKTTFLEEESARTSDGQALSSGCKPMERRQEDKSQPTTLACHQKKSQHRRMASTQKRCTSVRRHLKLFGHTWPWRALQQDSRQQLQRLRIQLIALHPAKESG